MRLHAAKNRARGALQADMLVALAILVCAAMPLAYSSAKDHKLLRANYHRAVAMSIVDGEMELLVAGEWHAWTEGEHELKVRAESAKNLPPGRFTLTRRGDVVRLEWTTDKPRGIGKVVREVNLKTLGKS